jgi:hypothetical protein
MPRCETTTRDQYGTGSSFIDFDREQGSNVFAQRPLTKGAVLSAIGDKDVTGDCEKSRSGSLDDKQCRDTGSRQ